MNEHDPDMDGMLPTSPEVLDKLPNRIYSMDVGYKILDDESILLHVPIERKPELVHILNRALNCWPECPPEWKHLADILQHGAPLVDYYEQEASTKMRHKNPE